MKKTILSIRNLSISFEQYGRGLKKFISTPIKDLNIEINKGEILAIVGASGSGKSLLAHAVMGILQENTRIQGEMIYEGQILNRELIKNLRGKKIAFIPQSINYLDPSMKVKNQVKIGLHCDVTAQKKIQEGLFKQFDLKKTDGDLYPYELSGGMLRRVLFATSMGKDIELIIADEPTPGIHQDILDRVLKQLRDFADAGMSVVLITHDIISATKIADYITVFRDGKNIETAPREYFSGNGEKLKEEYTRKLWRSLPQNDFLKGV